MTTQHTPTPWCRMYDGTVIRGFDCTDVVQNVKTPEDAAFIVKACNAHDANVARIAELEAALRKIEASCDGDDAGAMFNPRAACKVAVKAARAALA